MANYGSIIALSATSQEKNDLVDFLIEREAYTKDSSVTIDDTKLKEAHKKYRQSMKFLKKLNGKVWIDVAEFSKYKDRIASSIFIVMMIFLAITVTALTVGIIFSPSVCSLLLGS